MPILRIQYVGGPLNGTVGNVAIEVPAETTEWAVIYTGNPLIGSYTINPQRLHVIHDARAALGSAARVVSSANS